jgi:protein SCO1
MKFVHCLYRLLCCFTVSTALLSTALATELPRNSVYQLDVMLTDQDGHTAPWRAAASPSAGPRIVGMFYSRCDYVCPMLFEAIKNIEAQLPPAQRQRLQVGLITIDPARDDVTALQKTAAQRSGDPARWHLYRTQPSDVRKLAGVLGVQYRQLSNGEFNHSTHIILLDPLGVELARSDQIAKPDPGFIKAVLKACEIPK